jgi:hypothetical protein
MYILRLPNIYHKKNGHFPHNDHGKKVKNIYNTYHFIEEISAINEYQYEDWMQSDEDSVKCLESHTQNHRNLSPSTAVFSPHLPKVKYIYVCHMCSSQLNIKYADVFTVT